MTQTPSEPRPGEDTRQDPNADGAPQIRVNGEARALPQSPRVGTLVDELGLSGRKIAVAVNRQVVPRSERDAFVLRAGDHVEILEAVGGG